MPDLLLELFSEEIPARMQAKAAEDLKTLFLKGFKEAGLAHGAARGFATPRRLTLLVEEVAAAASAVSEEIKGPRTDAPEKALEGFLRKTGLAKEQLEVRDDKKGQVYFAVIEKPARPAGEIVAELAPQILRAFPWPKSMRWGSGDFRWVRPLRSVLCLLCDDDKVEVPPFEVGGLTSGAVTYGHRFHTMDKKTGLPKPIEVTSVKQYKSALRRAKVILDPIERQEAISRDARRLAEEAGLELVEDRGLLAEVAGLVEHPVALLGPIAEEFQRLPPEVLRTSMKEHQKFFSARDPKSGRITGFVTVANIEAPDGGATILAGNERVLKARLSDAMFFFENDLAVPLEKLVSKLDLVTFHNQLGSQGARVKRLERLSSALSALVGASGELAVRAAAFAKADLSSEMVYEFPELQGYMGAVYAREAGERPEVANAIEYHYAPLGPSDNIPTEPVAIAVALADKLDQLAAFWAIGAKPTGSGDPFALRRAALGVIRIVLENELELDLGTVLKEHELRLAPDLTEGAFDSEVRADLMAFFADRLKVFLRDQGVRHDVVEAVFRLDRQNGGSPAADLALAKRRIDAVGALLGSADGENLQAAFKRANNILTAEEKKDGVEYSLDPLHKLAREAEEKALFKALDAAEKVVEEALRRRDFTRACSAMAGLRGPLDAFFDKVVVNVDEATLRRNRLCLLNRIRATLGRIADFSALEG